MAKWSNVALIHAYFDEENIFGKPFQFDEGLALMQIPSWVKDKIKTDYIGLYGRENFIDPTEIAFVSEYADYSLGDPKRRAGEHKSKQDFASEKIIFASMALWIVNPTLINSFKLVIYAEEAKGQWIVNQQYEMPISQIHEKDEHNRLTYGDLELARKLYKNMLQVGRNKTTWTAVRLVVEALSEYNSWEIRFLIFWIALEALFGTDAELSYRISLRIALFIAEDEPESKKLFKLARELYQKRSKVVHGRGLPGEKVEDINNFIYEVESLVRQSLYKIFSSKLIVSKFNSEDRDNYLDDLVFGKGNNTESTEVESE